jgi:hypothetical protein
MLFTDLMIERWKREAKAAKKAMAKGGQVDEEDDGEPKQRYLPPRPRKNRPAPEPTK